MSDETKAGIDRWRSTRILSYIWFCGDNACYCTQPVVERITPNLLAGYPWIKHERLWEGEFTSGQYENRSHEIPELKKAAKKFGIQVDKNGYGEIEESNSLNSATTPHRGEEEHCCFNCGEKPWRYPV